MNIGFFGKVIPQVGVEEVKKALDEKQDIVLLDVRTSDEYTKARITGSVLIPHDEIGKKIEKSIPDKNKKVYVYCLSGSRSVLAVDTLKKLGYKNVYNVTSGLLAWRAKQYPVEV